MVMEYQFDPISVSSLHKELLSFLMLPSDFNPLTWQIVDGAQKNK